MKELHYYDLDPVGWRERWWNHQLRLKVHHPVIHANAPAPRSPKFPKLAERS